MTYVWIYLVVVVVVFFALSGAFAAGWDGMDPLNRMSNAMWALTCSVFWPIVLIAQCVILLYMIPEMIVRKVQR